MCKAEYRNVKILLGTVLYQRDYIRFFLLLINDNFGFKKHRLKKSFYIRFSSLFFFFNNSFQEKEDVSTTFSAYTVSELTFPSTL